MDMDFVVNKLYSQYGVKNTNFINSCDEDEFNLIHENNFAVTIIWQYRHIDYIINITLGTKQQHCMEEFNK